MPNLRDIRKRVRSIKNTQQITRAMKMVAAAKLRRAQEAALAARPYASKMEEMLGSIAARADVSAHPLFQRHETGPVVVVAVTADRGLCGGFNSNLGKAVLEHIRGRRAEGQEVLLYPVGRKGREFFRRRLLPTLREKVNVFTKLTFGDARGLADELMELYLEGQAREVVIAYNEFKSVLAPRIVIRTLLPIPRPEVSAAAAVATDYIYEPAPAAILASLVPGHVRTQMWRVLLESWAAEQAARMAAMDTATKNAGDMIDSLTLTMNKTRQAAITRELIEVVSGAAALT